jgi:hypothetical protein
MSDRSSVPSRILGACQTRLGLGDSLENITTFTLDDGCLCYVTEAHLHFELHKDSTATPNGTTVIAPIAGPGRWVVATGGAGSQGAQGFQGATGSGSTGAQGSQGSQGAQGSSVVSPVVIASDFPFGTALNDSGTLAASLPGDGQYVFAAAFNVTQASSSGVVALDVTYTDNGGVKTKRIISGVDTSGTNSGDGQVVMYALATTPVSWQLVETTPVVGPARYSMAISLTFYGPL